MSDLSGVCFIGKGWQIPGDFAEMMKKNGLALYKEDGTAPGCFMHRNHAGRSLPEDCRNLLYLTNEVAAYRRLNEQQLAVVYVAEATELSGIPWEISRIVMSPFSLTGMELKNLFERQKGMPLTIAETKSLLIRETVSDDLPALYSIYEEEAGNAFLEPLFGGRKEAEALLKYQRCQYEFYGFGMWSVCRKDTKEVIGRMGFEATGEENVLNFGYVFAGRYRKHGLATEAANALLMLAKERKWGKKCRIVTGEQNTASVRLAEKLSFQLLDRSGDILTYERGLDE